MAFRVYSVAFDDGGFLPARYSADGADRSPPLAWVDPPADTAGFAVLCIDPDAPGGTWYHWARYDIPRETHGLEEGHPAGVPPAGGKEAVNDFGKTGYGGPAPPPSHRPHRYVFTVLALDVPTLGLGPCPGARDVEHATAGHVLAEASIMARYGRREQGLSR